MLHINDMILMYTDTYVFINFIIIIIIFIVIIVIFYQSDGADDCSVTTSLPTSLSLPLSGESYVGAHDVHRFLVSQSAFSLSTLILQDDFPFWSQHGER